MIDHGRPPSYPTVVTTITSGNGATMANNSSSSEINGPNTTTKTFTAAPPPPSTLEVAARLYELDGNAIASLEACRRLWNDQRRADADQNGGTKNAANDKIGAGQAINNGEFEKKEVPLSRQHNRAVLEHLSTLRSQRCRIRRRPSSFDMAGDVDSRDHDNWKESENLAVILSSMLAEKPTSRQDDLATNEGPKDSKPRSTANAVPTVTLNEKEKKKKKESIGEHHQLEYNQLVGSYNVCLSHYTAGNYQEALNSISIPFITAMESIQIDGEGVKMDGGGEEDNYIAGDNEKSSSISYLVMTTRIAFLILDCHFALNAGTGLGLGPLSAKGVNEAGDTHVTFTMDEIFTWVENNVLALTSKGEDTMDIRFPELCEFIKYDELKFRLHLYRSRMLFLGNSSDTSANPNNDLEARIRTSRKELKNAMDIYQNKLCIAEEGNEPDKRGKHSKQNGGSRSDSGGGGNEGGSYPLTSVKGKSHQDVSETTSVTSMAGGSLVTSVSDALWSEGKGGVGATRAMFEGMPCKSSAQQQQQQLQISQLPSSSANVKVKKKITPSLQVRHESVLYLKARLETARGNTPKSLKLCAEARLAGKKSRPVEIKIERQKVNCDAKGNSQDTTADREKHETLSSDGEAQAANDYDEAIYYNNLALVHHSAGKIHLALHYYSYASSFVERVKLLDKNSFSTDGHQTFWSDGAARPDISAEILHNTSICAFQTQEFNRAYECMARCLKMSPNTFGKQARCWLRMAQSCIGIYTNLQQKAKNELHKEGNVTRLDSNYFGSEEDLQSISTNPLQRASFCLYHTLHLGSRNFDHNVESPTTVHEIMPFLKDWSTDADMDCFKTALVSIAYIKLQSRDRMGAFEICQLALRLGLDYEDKGPDTVTSLRLREMAEMYSREATIGTAG